MLRYKIKSIPTDNSICLSLGQNMATNIFQESLMENELVNNEISKNIPEIIDYEKKVFVPMYSVKDIWSMSGDTVVTDITDEGEEIVEKIDDVLTPLNKLTFQMYFRERNIKESGEDYIDYGSWSTSDELYWNATNFNWEWDNGDPIGYLGFDDDDVYFQKKALSKSFVRIGIYDSPYRESQKLLYYSTLFFDTNKLYSNYIKECASGGGIMEKIEDQYVYRNSSLTSQVSCTNKYNNEASSDGFYLYLYDTVVTGNSFTKLYMKVEFNNAKYGVTVPFMCPTSESGNILRPSEKSFPIDFSKKNESGETISVDFKRLYDALYIPIYVKYNQKTKQYNWFFAPLEKKEVIKGNGEAKIKLYEPRINSTD